MVWKESEPGIWLDDFDGAEKVFYNMSLAFVRLGKEHGAVSAVCKINAQNLATKVLLETLFRDAWKALRFDFPALSVVAKGSSKKKYLAATPERVEDWVNETFSVNSHHSAEDIVPTLHLKKLPCLIFLPPSSEIIFHSSHWRIDALGTCQVLDRLFDIVSQGTTASVPWDLEYQNLSPSLEDAFGSPQISTPAMETIAQDIRTRNFSTSCPSAGLPFTGPLTTPPSLSRPRSISLTPSATSTLIAACKAHSISVTAAIHAACADVVFDLSKHNSDANYSTVVSANVRSLLPAPLPQQRSTATAAYACGTYVTGITHTVRRASDFDTRSAALTKAYRGDWAPDQYMAALRPIYRVHGEALVANAARAGTRPPASNVTVSSLGVVEKYLRREYGGAGVGIVVERFRLGSAIMTRQPTLYIWTWRERLTLSVDYNEAFYGEEAMQGLLEGIRGNLERGLGLKGELGLETDVYG